MPEAWCLNFYCMDQHPLHGEVERKKSDVGTDIQCDARSRSFRAKDFIDRLKPRVATFVTINTAAITSLLRGKGMVVKVLSLADNKPAGEKASTRLPHCPSQ